MKQTKRTTGVPELIVRKREGGRLTEDDIRGLLAGFMDGTVAD